ncbi:ImmA/IrrE family metallo-endopeptidase [Streptomyces sp. NPDC059982]|uniref:ImmA/IrrE family metallo-endopeptidase n=1 Tax=unclassified Streptomyces TaxID=2593676 RepID=UPI003689DD75
MTTLGGAGPFFIDLDGFIPKSTYQYDMADPSEVELSIVHYLLRSAVTLGEGCGEDAWAVFKKFSRQCLADADLLARDWQNHGQPDWLRGFPETLKGSPDVTPSAVEDISFSFTLSPKIQAFSFPEERRIEISAVTPVHLRTVNLVLWSEAMRIRWMVHDFKSKQPAGSPWGIQEMATVAWSLVRGRVDLLLPYLFSLYFSDVNYSGLPIPRAPNAALFARSRQCALAQMQFMLTHECAHLLMHENRDPDPSLEREADAFAYKTLLSEEGFWKSDHALFFTSNRWFFNYLALDRIIGAVLSGYEIDWVDLPIRDRELPPEYLNGVLPFPSGEEQECQLIGNMILLRAKQDLSERGVDWIRSAASEFKARHCYSQ